MSPTVPSRQLHHGIIFTCSLALALIAARCWATSSRGFVFLNWNLFLAALPVVFAELAVRARLAVTRAVCLMAWLLFFPNAAYLVTDLIHLKYHPSAAPAWFDVGLFASFAIAGLMLAVAALEPIHRMAAKRFGRIVGWAFAIATCGLSGLGIYLGRFLRFNSWDIITKPDALLIALLDRFVHPMSHPRTWGVTMLFGLLLLGVYVALTDLPISRRASVTPRR